MSDMLQYGFNLAREADRLEQELNAEKVRSEKLLEALKSVILENEDMSELTRYSPGFDPMELHKNGEWCLYEDAQSQISSLKAKLEAAEKVVEFLRIPPHRRCERSIKESIEAYDQLTKELSTNCKEEL